MIFMMKSTNLLNIGTNKKTLIVVKIKFSDN